MATDLIISTSLLYGVFVSEKSYLIGVRNLIKREHAAMLAMKVTGHLLQTELVDLIADQLYELEKRTVKRKWMTKPPAPDDVDSFLDFASTSLAEAAFSKLKGMSVSAIQIGVGKPGGNRVIGDANALSRYVHLSAVKKRPSVCFNIPSTSSGEKATLMTAKGLEYKGSKGTSYTACLPAASNITPHPPPHYAQPSKDTITYMADRRLSDTERQKRQPLQTSRLLGCLDIEIAMRGWDAEALKAFVKLLDLHVVPFDEGEGDPLKPGLHIWQRVTDCSI